MAHNIHLLQSLCRDPETLSQAQSILRIAQKKTGPGSGHELGAHTTGLPAICAHIASQRLKNNEVSRKTAQVASCLKSSDFEKAFHIVEAAIGGSRRKTAVKEGYSTLLTTHNPSLDHEQLLDWARAAERALLQGDTRFTPDDTGVRPVIFFWVYQAATGRAIQAPQPYAEDNNIPFKNFKKILDVVTKNCASLALRIQSERSTKRASPVKAGATPRRSPTKPVLRALPSKDSPQKRKAEEPQKEQDIGVSDVDLLDTLLEPETPVKKRRIESPSKVINHTSPRKTPFVMIPSSSRLSSETEGDGKHTETKDINDKTLNNRSTPKRLRSLTIPRIVDAMDVDSPSSDEDEDDVPLPRRFRPVFLDHQQWLSRDPRLNRLWKQTEKRKQELVKMYGHPFEKYRPLSIDSTAS